MATLQFWLTADEERFRFPVNPDQLTIKTAYGYDDVKVSQLGEYTIFGDPVLSEYAISSFFPRHYHPGYCEYPDLPDPWQSALMLERWMRGGRPVQFAVTGTEIETPVTIRSFSYGERAGSPGDIYFELELKQYVYVSFRQVDSSKGKRTVLSGAGRPSDRQPPSSYVVVPRDTLWKIAQRTMGDGDRWREIYEANRTQIGKDPNRIYVGQVLKVPR